MDSHRISCGMYAPHQDPIGHSHILRPLRIQEPQDGNRYRFWNDRRLVGQSN